MDTQEWIPVMTKNRFPKKPTETLNNAQPLLNNQIIYKDTTKDTAKYTYKHINKDINVNKNDEDKPIHIKHINPESLQSLIRKRIELKLNQKDADNKCAFPRNTFKEIECNRLIPNEEQKRRIHQIFGIQLKINVIAS